MRGGRGGVFEEVEADLRGRVRWGVRGGCGGMSEEDGMSVRGGRSWLDEPKTSHLRSTHRMCFHSNVHQPESVVAGNHIVHGVQWVGLHCSYYVTSGFIGGGVQRK